MWIMTNKGMISIVEDRNDSRQVVVRSRIAGHLEEIFPDGSKVHETEDSDYRFRMFLDRHYVAAVIYDLVADIDYYNFKDSVKEPVLKRAYSRIWSILFAVQESKYTRTDKWWLTYDINN